MIFSPLSNRPRTELELRTHLLRLLLIATAAGAVIYLLVGVAGVVASRLFPWDGLGMLVLSAGCGWLVRQAKTPLAASLFLSGVSQPFFYASQFYGVSSPVNALFALGLVICGLLIGDWFLGLWTIGYCLWMLLAAIGELNGWWTPPGAIRDTGRMFGVLVFWWAMFGATGWLVWLFARNLKRAVQSSRSQTMALSRTLAALNVEAGLDTFLGQALAVIVEQLQARYATLWFYDAAQGMLMPQMGYSEGRIVLAEQMSAAMPQAMPASDSPIWQELVAVRRPIVLDDISNDPRLIYRALLLQQGIKAILYVPLLLDDQLIGMFSINSIERRRYQPDEIELVQSLSQQITLAMQLTRLADQVQRAAVVEERNRMAREIHDTLAQGFTGIVVQLEAAEDALTDAPDAAQLHLARARTLARESLAEARRSVWALRPQLLEAEDLASALAHTLRQATAGMSVQAHVQVYGTPRALPHEIESNLLRIGQEMIANALKHAHADAIDVDVLFDARSVCLSIRDNGRGFDPQRAANGGFGLTSMRERAERIGGVLTIASRAGAGTDIKLVVPLPIASLQDSSAQAQQKGPS